MSRRKNRKSIVYRPKGKGNRKRKTQTKNGDEIIVPSGRAWDNMHLFGAFSIDDKGDTNQKYRFRRGDIATILPSHVSPGDPIEPHQYWVGKILEIRADQGCLNSEQIWTKVQWLYSPEETKALIPSLDLSTFGKYERIWSDHWDFVYPHAFNEVITLPRLLPFPRTSPIPILQPTPSHTPKPRGQRNESQRSRELSLLSSASSTPTTITTVATDAGSSTTTPTTVASALTVQDLMAQRVIGPETFYWRYTLSVDARILGPEPTSQSNCICSNPCRPDDTSLRSGVMIFCPRPGCGTGYHLGCLEDINCVWVDGDGKGNSSKRKSAVKGKGKKRADVNEPRAADDEEEEEEKWLSERAIRQISTSSDSKNAYIDLLSLPAKRGTQKKARKGGELVISLLERVYDLQLEQHYRYSESKFTSSQPRHKSKPKKLTPNSLLASLFILPPPFPLPPSPSLSKQQKRQRQQQCELHLLLAVACQPLFRGGRCFEDLGPTGNVNAVLCAREFIWEVVRKIGELDLDLEDGCVSRGDKRGRGAPVSAVGGFQEELEDEDEDEQQRRDRECFTRIRECAEGVLDGYRRRFFPPSMAEGDGHNSGNETDNGNTGNPSDEGDNGGGSVGLMKDSVVPLDGVVEDAIIVKKGLLFFDYLHRSKKKKRPFRTLVDSNLNSDINDEEDADANDAESDTERGVDVEGDVGKEGSVVAGMTRVKDEPLSDVDIVEETEQEGEGMRDDDDDAYTSADEIDDMLLASHRKRKRSTVMVTRGNCYQMRKKFKAGLEVLGGGGGWSDDSVSDEDDDEVIENDDGEEEDEEDREDAMLLNADWACPACRGSI